jgi:hypothetical protein
MNASLHNTAYNTAYVKHSEATAEHKEYACLQVSDIDGNYVTLYFPNLREIQYFLSQAGNQADKLIKKSAKENLIKVLNA